MDNVPDIEQAANELGQLMPMPFAGHTSYDSLHKALSVYINNMIVHDFSSLVQVLYVMDIPEKKLRAVLSSPSHDTAGDTIAALMIERQLQKIETRRTFKTDGPITDEERW